MRALLFLTAYLSGCSQGSEIEPVVAWNVPQAEVGSAAEELPETEEAEPLPPASCEDVGRYPEVDYSVCYENEEEDEPEDSECLSDSEGTCSEGEEEVD